MRHVIAKLQLWLAIAWPPMGLEERFAGPMSRTFGVRNAIRNTYNLGVKKTLDPRPLNLILGLADVIVCMIHDAAANKATNTTAKIPHKNRQSFTT